MRVITGSARGRRLKELEGMETRCSTAPNSESCCDLLKRCISSMKRMGLACEKKRLLLARSITSRTSFTPLVTALSV